MKELITAAGIVSPELEEKIDRHLESTGRVYLDTRGQSYTCTMGAKEDEDNSFHLTYRNERGAFEMLSQFRFPRQYISAESGDVLGNVLFLEPAFPGASYYGVEVTTPEALACLQVSLNACSSGIRLRPRYFQRSRADLLAELDALARGCDQVAPGPGGWARGMASMDASRLRKAAESLRRDPYLSPVEVLTPSAFSGYHIKEAVRKLLGREGS